MALLYSRLASGRKVRQLIRKKSAAFSPPPAPALKFNRAANSGYVVLIEDI
jgi:hypothetical protein